MAHAPAMKNILLAFTLLGILYGQAAKTPEAHEEDFSFASPVWVSALKVNIREEPSTNSTIVWKALLGDRVYLQETQGSWMRILFSNIQDPMPGAEIEYWEGWIRESFVSRQNIDAADIRRITFVKTYRPDKTIGGIILEGKIRIGMTKSWRVGENRRT